MDEFGDETEYDIIINAGIQEAIDFNARWLNPPHSCPPDTWHDFAIWRPEQFIYLNERKEPSG